MMFGFLKKSGVHRKVLTKHSPYVGGDITVIGTGGFPFSEERHICIMGKLA